MKVKADSTTSETSDTQRITVRRTTASYWLLPVVTVLVAAGALALDQTPYLPHEPRPQTAEAVARAGTADNAAAEAASPRQQSPGMLPAESAAGSPLPARAASKDAGTSSNDRGIKTVQLYEAQPPPPEAAAQDNSDGELRVPLGGTKSSTGQIELHGENGLLSLMVRNAALNEVLATVAQSQRLNIVCGDTITARISITLDRVPLQDALTAILSVAGYSWVERNGIIHVTNVSTSSTLAPEVQGRIVRVFPLSFASANDVSLTVKGLVSPVGKAFVSSTDSTNNRKTQDVIVVEDLPSYVKRIERYIEEIDQPPRQVMLTAHILQIDLQNDARHGVNFTQIFNPAGRSIKFQMQGFANAAAPQAFFASLDAGEVDGLIECLQTTTDAKTLASPKVLVVNGQQARMQVGQQLGFRVTTTTETSTLESVQFLDVGVVLRVTPHIGANNQIVMRVKPEVSKGEISPDTNLPQKQTTEVETDVILNDGQGMVIGGLIQENDSNIQSKVSYLGDIWILGKLFQRRQLAKSRSEIVVTLVPTIVPYPPCIESRHQVDVERAGTELYSGPLERRFRPWDARLPDSIENPACGPNLVKQPPYDPNYRSSDCQQGEGYESDGAYFEQARSSKSKNKSADQSSRRTGSANATDSRATATKLRSASTR